MAYQIVITEKSSQAKDVRAAVGSRYGDILPAEGHLFDLLEPEDVVPEWKRWSPILLRPEDLYGTRPAEGGNKAVKLRAIREALRTAPNSMPAWFISGRTHPGWTNSWPSCSDFRVSATHGLLQLTIGTQLSGRTGLNEKEFKNIL